MELMELDITRQSETPIPAQHTDSSHMYPDTPHRALHTPLCSPSLNSSFSFLVITCRRGSFLCAGCSTRC